MGYDWQKLQWFLSGEECEHASLPVPRGLSSYLKWAHIFQEQWGKRQDSFLHKSLSATNRLLWGYSYQSCKRRRYGAFSAKNANLPRRMCERKVVTKRRMGRWIRIRQWADFRPAPGTHRVTGASLPKPQIISLCHVPLNSESGSVLLLSGTQ